MFRNPQSKAESAFVVSVTEMSLGSLIHGFKIPLGGHFLSILQILWMSRYRKSHKNSFWTSEFEISVIAAVMKSLSPMGKRFTPMIALTVQGFLFSIVRFISRSVFVAGVVVSMWAFVQPLVIAYLLFGKSLIDSFYWAVEKAQLRSIPLLESVVAVWIAFIFTKAILVVWMLKSDAKSKLDTSWVEQQVAKYHESAVTGAQASSGIKSYFKAITRPLFLVSVILMTLFFYYSDQSKTSAGNWVFLAIRPFGVMAFLVFVFPYMITEKSLKYLERAGFVSASKTLKDTLQMIREF